MAGLDTAKISEKLKFKKNLVLHAIRRSGQVGRLELARKLRMSTSRLCEFVQEMIDEGGWIEDHVGADRRGRRAVPVRVNPRFGHLVGFDMEAKRLRLIAVDFSGKVVWQRHKKLTPPKDRRALVNRLLGFIDTGLKEIKGRFNNVLGVGLAGAGTVDVRRGVILHYALLESASNIPLRDLVADRTSLPCILEDNIRALTMAEWIWGSASHLHNFICLAVRSGIGAGIVIDGKLYSGSHGFAGEAGLMSLPLGPTPSQWKYLHDVASEQALDVDVESRTFKLSKPKATVAGRLLGLQLASLATFMDPQAIVLAGGLVQPDGPLYDSLARTFRRFVLADIADRVQLIPARLGPFAAAMGAAHRCFQMLYPTEPRKI